MVSRSLILKQIIPFINEDIIKVITGVRRSGKSEMLKIIRNFLKTEGVDESQFIVLNFEDLYAEKYKDYHKLNDYLEEEIERISPKASYVFLDEIQEVKQFEKVVNSIRSRHGSSVDIYITGSNADLLSGELATVIGGRYVQFNCYPFLFSEYIDGKSDSEIKDINLLFDEFVKEGGMPFVATKNMGFEARKAYLSDVYSSIILKDVIQRENIRDVDLLKRIFAFAVANTGREFSANSVVKYLKNEGINTTATTVINYLEYGMNAFGFIPVTRYSIKDKKYLSNKGKYYIVDHGLRQAIIGRNDENIELILENIVLMELRARGYEVSVGTSASGYEVDFIAEKTTETGLDRKYFQVCLMMVEESTREREFRALEEIKNSYPKYILSLDRFLSDKDGIRHLNLIEWLLDK